jgi:hypothetical protein
MAEVARAEQLPNAIPTLLSTLADFHIVARFFLVLSIFIIAVGRQLVSLFHRLAAVEPA